MNRFRRILKWTTALLIVLLAIPAVGIAIIWGTYEYVVHKKPGSLPTGVDPIGAGWEVDPFIGTGGVSWMCAHNTPAATVPFGLVRLGPDTASLFTNTQGFNRSGYFYGDNKIIGFSHTRLIGADALEGGVFRIFPTTLLLVPGEPGKNRFARFSHDGEKAFPGYYAVRLPKDDILVELTATTRVGFHRYTFPANAAPHLQLDVTSALGDRRCENGQVWILPEQRQVEGSARLFGSFSGRYDGLDVYFVAEFDQAFDAFGIWNGTEFREDARAAQGNRLAVDLGFANTNERQPIEVRLALSYVSIANARENLEAETGNRSFETICQNAQALWQEKLDRIQIRGGSEWYRRSFYTALYRAFQMPTTFNDVNGEYTGFDRAVHEVSDGVTYYTDFSLWDSFRTVHPLYNLIARDEQRDMMVSLVEMAKAGGGLPRWPSGCGYTNCMFGTPADIAVTEAYLKGIRGFDIEVAYEKMRQTALVGKPADSRFSGRDGLVDYLKYGYCPSDSMSKAVSATLEYAWCDHALSLLARALGHDDDAATFARNAQSYRNLWDASRLFFVPRDSNGVFMENFDPLVLSYTDWDREYTDDFVEGSAMMWRWGVPFDPEGLVSLFPSKEQFVQELEDYFERTNDTVGQWHPGSYYWHGNEPFFHAAYLFNTAGRPDLTQKWVRRILDTKYSNSYVGLDGNDDGGTLSAWFVFSALGFYPIAGTTRYEIGAPLFPEAVLDLGDGKSLTVIAENYAPENLYVHAVSLNGRKLTGWSFTHDQIADGGELRFTMAAAPGG